MPRRHFGMQRIAECMVKAIVVAGDVDGAEIVTVDPIAFSSQLRANTFEESGAWQRVGE
jgi:hypothetical protein